MSVTAAEKEAARKAAKAAKERERRAKIKAEKDSSGNGASAPKPARATAGSSEDQGEKRGSHRLRTKDGRLTSVGAIVQVLEEAGSPLHVKDIAGRVIDGALAPGLKGKTPEASIAATLSVDARKDDGLFVKVERGTFDLRDR